MKSVVPKSLATPKSVVPKPPKTPGITAKPKLGLSDQNHQKLSDANYFKSKLERRRDIVSSNAGMSSVADTRIYRRQSGAKAGMQHKSLSI